jgi:hypothetical protein
VLSADNDDAKGEVVVDCVLVSLWVRFAERASMAKSMAPILAIVDPGCAVDAVAEVLESMFDGCVAFCTG